MTEKKGREVVTVAIEKKERGCCGGKIQFRGVN